MARSSKEEIFRAGRFVLAGDILLYLFAVVHLRTIAIDTSRLTNTLHVSALYFVLGSALSLIALLLIVYGRGSKKLPVSLACIATLPFWYGLTIY
jgi:hypothetical protein